MVCCFINDIHVKVILEQKLPRYFLLRTVPENILHEFFSRIGTHLICSLIPAPLAFIQAYIVVCNPLTNFLSANIALPHISPRLFFEHFREFPCQQIQCSVLFPLEFKSLSDGILYIGKE